MDDSESFGSSEIARLREETKRAYESLKRIEALSLQLKNELIQYNDTPKGTRIPFFRKAADETINNIWIFAKRMADRTGGV